MRMKIAVVATLFSTVFVLSLIAPPVSSQHGPADGMSVDSKMTISGVSSLRGSGSAEIAFSGDAAVGLREKIILKFDGILTHSPNGQLDAQETGLFLKAVSDGLVGKIYWGIGIESATNFTDRTDAFITSRTSGLVETPFGVPDNITFKLNFEGKGSGSSKTLETAQAAYDSFAEAVFEATGYQFNGTMTIHQRLTTFALGSFTGPDLPNSRVTGIRTPFGEVLWYSFTGAVQPFSTVSDSLDYRSFSLIESQQISFVVLVVGLLLLVRMPGSDFGKFEKLHPRKFRKYAKPLMTVKVSMIVLAVVLVLLYLLPFAFSFMSRESIFYTAYLYLLVPAAVLGQHYFSRAMYNKAALSIPDESIIEVKQAVVQPEEGEGEILCKACYRPIEAGLDLFQCSCGANMHLTCAEKAQNCPNCGTLLFPERTRSIECRSCGQTFMYTGVEDPYAIQCSHCGAFQEEIKAGKNYLVVDADPRNAFAMIRAMALSGRPALCLTTSFPGKIRSDYDLMNIDIKWLSDSSTDIDNINPKDLEGDSMEVVSTFLMTTKGAGVMIDGVAQLIEMNGFDKVFAFVKRLNDLAAIHGSTIVLSINKQGMPEDQFKRISDAFDEIHDYQ